MSDPVIDTPPLAKAAKSPAPTGLPDPLMLQMHELMLTSRVLEERLIRMQRQGDGYFWIGGPGEEAFNTALGLLVKKGRGPAYDFLHLHYRSSATIIAMGADPVDSLRLMANSANDPYTRGRNFAGHYSIREWNVCPISSPIEVQYSIAIGSAMAQRRHGLNHGSDGITIVQGGDAGSAEGDFATCLVWSSRPKNELPILIIVTNNEWGISTHSSTQHGDNPIAGRGIPFGMKTMVVDGNDAVGSYQALQEAMGYVRKERRPLVLEARVSRLHGHSSSSGANRNEAEVDCLAELEKKLQAAGLRDDREVAAMRATLTKHFQEAAHMAVGEPKPAAETIHDHIFAERNVVAEY